jgi:hypothetical protein
VPAGAQLDAFKKHLELLGIVYETRNHRKHEARHLVYRHAHSPDNKSDRPEPPLYFSWCTQPN